MPGTLAEQIEDDKAQRASLNPTVPMPSMPVPMLPVTGSPPVMPVRLVALAVVVRPLALSCVFHLPFLPRRLLALQFD
jgi:hypothetical protein